MKTTNIISSLKILFIAGLLGIGTAYVNAAWVEPSCGDVSCNTNPPIHEGSADQVKTGGLSVNALGVRAGAVAGYVLTAKDTNGTAEWKPVSGGGIFGGLSLSETAMTKQNTEYTASCPDGKVAIGGGIKPEDYATKNAITGSHPSPTTGIPTAWKCSKVGYGTCFVICANQ